MIDFVKAIADRMGYRIITVAQHEALLDCDHLLRSQGYHLDVREDGNIVKSRVSDNAAFADGKIRRRRTIEFAYAPENSPWRRKDARQYEYIETIIGDRPPRVKTPRKTGPCTPIFD